MNSYTDLTQIDLLERANNFSGNQRGQPFVPSELDRAGLIKAKELLDTSYIRSVIRSAASQGFSSCLLRELSSKELKQLSEAGLDVYRENDAWIVSWLEKSSSNLSTSEKQGSSFIQTNERGKEIMKKNIFLNKEEALQLIIPKLKGGE